MTSSRKPAIEALPPALPSMWRLCKLGYQHEPQLIVAAFLLALLAAVPDALLAYWFKLIGDAIIRQDWTALRLPMIALAVSATATWFLQVVSTRVQRRFRDKVTISLESHVATLARLDRDDRAPGAARVRRSPVGAAQSGLHARPHVHVGLRDVCVDSAAGHHPRTADVDSPGAGAAGAVRGAAIRDIGLASRRRTARLRAGRAGQPPGAAPVRHGHDRRGRKGSAAHQHRPAADRRSPHGVGKRSSTDRRGAMAIRDLAFRGMGDLRRRLCRCDRLRVVGPRRASGRCAPHARRRLTPLALRRRDRRRSGISPLLDGFARSGWRGSKTTPRHLPRRPIRRCPIDSPMASPSIASPSRIRAAIGSCSTTSP